jgi:hypothetical protein
MSEVASMGGCRSASPLPSTECGSGPVRMIREVGSWADFFHAAASMPHIHMTLGYQTPDQCARWFAGERVLFDELSDWIADSDLLIGDAVFIRDDFGARLGVAFSREGDAVAFVLRWGDHIDVGWR